MLKRGSINKKQREEEQQAIGAIYKQYIDTFQEVSEIPHKTFVKSGTLYAECGKENTDKGQLYNPKPIIKLRRDAHKPKPSLPPPPVRRTNKKSNLKSLGDELKMLQHERQLKEVKMVVPRVEPTSSLLTTDNDYTNSTNLFVSNLSPQITENHLIELFGVYGPLASVKIMWPRTELASRSANCGFVAFMSRSDAERALDALKNHEDMRINWGKSVKIPAHPVHIPPELYKLYSPPPLSGLPFNAQITTAGNDSLASTVIKVTIPFDRNLLMTIHRMIEFVVREGPEFEALMMGIEANNPEFRFLSDYTNPAHSYYRWKLFSMLNGDPKHAWSMKPFRMYENGSVWVPPTAPNYKDGMPRELLAKVHTQSARLTDTETARLIRLIKNLKGSRGSVKQAMAFCVNHANAIKDAVDIVIDSLKNPTTVPVKKIARLYLLTDVLYNCRVKHISVECKPELCLEVFKHFHATYKELKHSQDKECFKMKVMSVLRAWILHKFYSVKQVGKFENVMLSGTEAGEDDDTSPNDEPLDGANLLKRSFRTATSDCCIVGKKQSNDKCFDMFNPHSFSFK